MLSFQPRRGPPAPYRGPPARPAPFARRRGNERPFQPRRLPAWGESTRLETSSRRGPPARPTPVLDVDQPRRGPPARAPSSGPVPYARGSGPTSPVRPSSGWCSTWTARARGSAPYAPCSTLDAHQDQDQPRRPRSGVVGPVSPVDRPYLASLGPVLDVVGAPTASQPARNSPVRVGPSDLPRSGWAVRPTPLGGWSCCDKGAPAPRKSLEGLNPGEISRRCRSWGNFGSIQLETSSSC